MDHFCIFLRLTTTKTPQEVAAELQAAYDDGVAGEFECRQGVRGVEVMFLRDLEDDLSGTVEQLALEFDTAGLAHIAACLMSDGWLPFPPRPSFAMSCSTLRAA